MAIDSTFMSSRSMLPETRAMSRELYLRRFWGSKSGHAWARKSGEEGLAGWRQRRRLGGAERARVGAAWRWRSPLEEVRGQLLVLLHVLHPDLLATHRAAQD